MLINVIASLQTPSLDISSEVELKFNHNLQEISKWKIQAFLKFSSVLVCGYEKCFQLKCSWNFPSWCHITEALPSLRAYLLQKKKPFHFPRLLSTNLGCAPTTFYLSSPPRLLSPVSLLSLWGWRAPSVGLDSTWYKRGFVSWNVSFFNERWCSLI